MKRRSIKTRTRSAGSEASAATTLVEEGKRRLVALQKYIMEQYEVQERITDAYLNPRHQPSTRKTLDSGSAKMVEDYLRVVQLPETPWASRTSYVLDLFNSIYSVGSVGLSAARWAGFFGAASLLPTLLLTAGAGYTAGIGLARTFAKAADITEAQWGPHPAGGSVLVKAASEFRGDLTASEKASLSKFGAEFAKQTAGVVGKKLADLTFGHRFSEAYGKFADLNLNFNPSNYATWKNWGEAVITNFLDLWVSKYVGDTFKGSETFKNLKERLTTLDSWAKFFGLQEPSKYLTTKTLSPEKLQKYYAGIKNTAVVLKTLTLWVWREVIRRPELQARLGPGLHTTLTPEQQRRRQQIRDLQREATGLDLSADETKAAEWAKRIESAEKEVKAETEHQQQVELQTKELIPYLVSFWNSQVQDAQVQAVFWTRYQETQRLLENYLGKDSSAHSPLTISRLAYVFVEDLNLIPVEKNKLLSSNKYTRPLTIEKGLRYDRPKLLTAFGTGSSLSLARSFMFAVNRLAIYSNAVYATQQAVLENAVLGNIAFDTTASEYRANKAQSNIVGRTKNYLFDLSLPANESQSVEKGEKRSFEVAGYSNTFEPLLRSKDEATARLLDFKMQPAKSAKLQYAIIYDDVLRSLVVALRGTLGLFDIATDADLRLRLYKDGYIHNGFYEQALYILEAVHNWIRARNGVREELVTIVFTGHSLGAGVAGVCTLMAVDNPDLLFGKRVLGVGFATPSSMTPNLAKRVCGYFHSFVLGQDAVPCASAYSLYRYGLRNNVLLPCAHKAGNCDNEDFLTDPIRDCQVFMPTIPAGSIQYCFWRLNGKIDPSKDVQAAKDLAKISPSEVSQYISPEIVTVHPAWMIDRLEIGPQTFSDHSMSNHLHLLRTFYFDMEGTQKDYELLTKSTIRDCLKNWRREFLVCPAYEASFKVPADVANEVNCALSIYKMSFAPDGRRLTDEIPSTKTVPVFFVPKIACNPSGTQDTEQVCESYYSQEEEAEKLFEPSSMIPALAIKYQQAVAAKLMALGGGADGGGGDENHVVAGLKRRGMLAQAILDAFRQAYSAQV